MQNRYQADQQSHEQYNNFNPEANSSTILQKGQPVQIKRQLTTITQDSNQSYNLSSYRLSSIEKLGKKVNKQQNIQNKQLTERYQPNNDLLSINASPSGSQSWNSKQTNPQLISPMPVTSKPPQISKIHQLVQQDSQDLSISKTSIHQPHSQLHPHQQNNENSYNILLPENGYNHNRSHSHSHVINDSKIQQEQQYSFNKCLDLQPVLQNRRINQSRYFAYLMTDGQKSAMQMLQSSGIQQPSQIHTYNKCSTVGSAKKTNKLIYF